MSQLEKDVELLESAIEDIEEEIEDIIDCIDPSDGNEDASKANGKVEKARLQLTELLDLIRNMKRDKEHVFDDKSKKTRISMLEDIDRLREELETMQEEKEILEEKMYEQGIKVRRLMEENKELKKNGGLLTKNVLGGKPRFDGSESEGEDFGRENNKTDDESSESESEHPMRMKKRLTPSQRIDNIMKRDTATLEDLFSKEELHEELTTRYGARDNLLVAFFSRPTIISALIDAIVNIPTPPINADPEDKEIPPVPYTASEILTSGIQPLTDMLCQQPMLHRFFALLDRPPPLPASPVASLWYKVMSHLLQVKSVELSVYIKENNILPKVVNHINSECVLNLLLTMLNTEAKLETYGDEFQWSHLQLIDLLGAKLDACAITEASSMDYPNVLHHTTALDNISEFLCEILTKYPFSSPLVIQMQEAAFVKRLVRNCFVVYPSDFENVPITNGKDLMNSLYASRLRGPVHCLQILVHILTLSANGSGYMDVELPPVVAELLNETSSSVEKLPAPILTIAAILKAFVAESIASLQPNANANANADSDDINAITAGGRKMESWHKNKLLLGEYRMRLLMVAVGLAKAGYFWSDHALLESGILQSILHIFFFLPWSNVVHSVVAEWIVGLLPPQSPSSRSGFCLVVLKDLHFFENTLKMAGKAERSTGFMGHFANLAIAINRAATSSQVIADYLVNFVEWPTFLQKMNALTETNNTVPKY